MATVSHSFSSIDFFALLELRHVPIPYPLQPATQIAYAAIADRRSQVSTDVHDNASWLRGMDAVAAVCASHRASVDLRYVVGERESGAVVLFDDSDTCWLISCDAETGRAAPVPAERGVAALLETLPSKPPASFSPVSVPSTVLGQLLTLGVSELDRERVARAAGTNLESIKGALASVGVVTGSGQLGVSVGTDASSIRSSTRITLTDGRAGRLLQTVTIDSAGTERNHWTPGTPAAVHRAVAELLTATSQGSLPRPTPVETVIRAGAAMTELSLPELRGAAADVDAVAGEVDRAKTTVPDGLAGGAESAGEAYAVAGQAYAAAAQPRSEKVLVDCVALLRNAAAALTATANAYQQAEDSAVASLNAIPTPWT